VTGRSLETVESRKIKSREKLVVGRARGNLTPEALKDYRTAFTFRASRRLNASQYSSITMKQDTNIQGRQAISLASIFDV
jgi:hypothetical protein